jgi:hypothetical protein
MAFQLEGSGGAGIKPLGLAEPNKIHQSFVNLVDDLAN